MTNTVLVLVGDLHRGVVKAIQYAQTLSPNAKAVFVETDPERTRRLEEKWGKYGMGVPLIVLSSPYRSLLGPLTEYIDHLQRAGREPRGHDRAAGVHSGALVAARAPQPDGASSSRARCSFARTSSSPTCRTTSATSVGASGRRARRPVPRPAT